MTTVMLGVPVVTASAQPAAAATGAPEGFVASLVLGKLDKVGAGGLPVGFAYAPDGRIFIARKTGVIDVWSGGVRKVFLDIQDEVNSRTGRGLLGIAIDPDYATNHRIFALFTQELDPAHPDQDTPSGGKIISIRAKAGTPDVADPATRVTLLSGYQSIEREHSVGGLRFDAAGNLLATFGDAKLPGIDEGQALVALNLDEVLEQKVAFLVASGEQARGRQ